MKPDARNDSVRFDQAATNQLTGDLFWSLRPALMSIAEVAPLLGRREATVASLASRHEIGAYKVAGQWLIAQIDLRGFAAGDAGAAKSGLALVIDPLPVFTGDVSGALAHLPMKLATSAVAGVLRVSERKLGAHGLAANADGMLDRSSVVQYLQSVTNFGPHYSEAEAS